MTALFVILAAVLAAIIHAIIFAAEVTVVLIILGLWACCVVAGWAFRRRV